MNANYGLFPSLQGHARGRERRQQLAERALRDAETWVAQHGLSQGVAHRVEWMGHVDDTPLRPDPRHRLRHPDAVGNALAEEQADDLAGARADLLTHHNPAPEIALEGREGPGDGVMVGDAHHVEFRPLDADRQLIERGHGIARVHGVQMAIDAHPSLRTRGGEVGVGLPSGLRHAGHRVEAIDRA